MELFAHRVVGPLECNCYVVGDAASRAAVVVDPGGDADDLIGAITERDLTVTAIVATHAHFDHVLAADRLREATGAPFLLHRDDLATLGWLQESGRLFLGLELPPPPEVDRFTSEGDTVTAGALELSVLHTPGHSPGSIALVCTDALFSGDTLFAGSVGRTDLPGGSESALLSAVTTKLWTLDEALPVLPGHGPGTTVGREQGTNPFVGRGGLWTG